MSRVKLVSFSENFPTLTQWSKQFRYRNAATPRATVASHSIAGNYNEKASSLFLKTNIFISPRFKELATSSCQ